VGAALSLVLAGSLLAVPSRPALSADPALCTEVVGFSQTQQWFYGGFLNVVDQARWQLRFIFGGDISVWADPSNWTGPADHPCATNAATPDRVIYDLTIAGYTSTSDTLYLRTYLGTVIANAHARYPSARVHLMPVIGGPNNSVCDWPISDPQQSQPYVRASWNHNTLSAAIAYALADHPEVGMAIDTEINDGDPPIFCAGYKDWIGHIADVALPKLSGAIANQMLAHFGGVPSPSPSPTPPPSPTPTATSTPSPVPSSSLPTPTATAPSSSITFDEPGNGSANRALNGQWPTGIADWGTGQWYLSGPWRLFTTNSISYPNGTPRSASFTFVVPKILVSVAAFNGGTVSSTVTLSCAGNSTVSQVLAANTTATITTGWTVPCSTSVTIGSSNGWDTNLDSIAYR
jgi:hypothetical protein